MKDKCTLRQEDVGVWNKCWVWTSFIWFLWEKARLLAPIPDSPMRHQFVLLPLHLNNHRETFLCSSSYFIPAPTCTLQLQSSSYVFTIFRYSMKECGHLWEWGSVALYFAPWLFGICLFWNFFCSSKPVFCVSQGELDSSRLVPSSSTLEADWGGKEEAEENFPSTCFREVCITNNISLYHKNISTYHEQYSNRQVESLSVFF